MANAIAVQQIEPYTELPPHVMQLGQILMGALGASMETLATALVGRVDLACKGLEKSRMNNEGAHNHGEGAPSRCKGECTECKAGKASACALGGGACETYDYGVRGDMMSYVRELTRRCYRPCRPLDECVVAMYMEDAKRLDAAAWEASMIKDGQLVHISKSVGAAPYEADLPLAANKKALLTQSDEQTLSYWPELIKLEPDWTGTAVPSKVKLRWFTGPKNLANVVDTSGLIQIGDTNTLSDFACGTSCYVIPFPSIKMCAFGHIPMERAVYLEVQTLGIGGATLAGLSAVIIKRGTEMWDRWSPKLLQIKACP